MGTPLQTIIDDLKKALKDSIEEGLIDIQWVVNQFDADDILDCMDIGDVIDYAHKNKPTD
jgi:hypothetical protein